VIVSVFGGAGGGINCASFCHLLIVYPLLRQGSDLVFSIPAGSTCIKGQVDPVRIIGTRLEPRPNEAVKNVPFT